MKKTLLAWSVASIMAPTAYALDNYDLLTQQAKTDPLLVQSGSSRAASLTTNQIKRSSLVDRTQQVYVHPVLGTPQFIWASEQVKPFSPTHQLTNTSQQLNAEQQSRQAGQYYLNAYEGMLGQQTQRHHLRFHSNSQASTNSAKMVRYTQEVNGIPVLGAGAHFLMDKNYQLVSIGATLAPVPKSLASHGGQEFILARTEAIALALRELTGSKGESGQIVTAENGFQIEGKVNGWNTQQLHVEKLYYPQKQGLIPAYRVSLRLAKTGEKTRHYGVILSAQNGRLLQRKNYTRELIHQQNSFQYRVFADADTGMPQDGPDGNLGSPHPTGKPDGFQAATVSPILLSMTNAKGSKVTDPWLPADAKVTTGNNVDAYLDIKAPDGFSDGDFRASVKAGNSLDHPFDGKIDAHSTEAQKSGAVTNLFYTINYLHDVYYDAGFDEKSGNAQMDNFGRGGKDKDPILAEGQDYSGFNNANMGTPPDGQSPVMQQYLFISRPDFSGNISGLTATAPELQGSRMGLKTFNLQNVPLVLANTAASDADLCQDLINGASFKDKGLVGVYDSAKCNTDQLVAKLRTLSVKGLIISDQGESLPQLITDNLNYPVLSSVVAADALAEIKSGKGQLTANFKADFVRDSTVSNMVVMHEWGHYLHERLAGNGQGL